MQKDKTMELTPKGVMGKIMVVDLTTRTIEIERVSPAVYRSFLSGMGLAAHILYTASQLEPIPWDLKIL